MKKMFLYVAVAILLMTSVTTFLTAQTITPKPTCKALNGFPATVWMAYNLGADSIYDTPKKQMEYQATHVFNETDATIYGGLFQWGRKDWKHAVDTISTPHRRYNSTDHAVYKSGGICTFNSTNRYNSIGFGQPVSGIVDTLSCFITVNGHTQDWRASLNRFLWGDTITMQRYKAWPKTTNDPCPTGWRLPTQDEWERLCNYNCDPTLSYSSFSSTIQAASCPSETNNPDITWVSVENGKAISDKQWTVGGSFRSGYAVYNTAVWNAAPACYKDGINPLYEPDAPAPLLYFPTAGYRSHSDGLLYGVGYSGNYWSSTVSEEQAYSLRFTPYTVSSISNCRAEGMSVRCVAE
jgi:hypothetical protein